MSGQPLNSGAAFQGIRLQRGRGHAAAMIAAAVVAALGAGSTAQGQLIAQDHFLIGATPGDGQYTATAFSGATPQDPTIAGFTGPWGNNVGAAGLTQWLAQNTALVTSSVTYEAGGRARFNTSGDNLTLMINRTLSPYTPVNTYYLSLLSNITTNEPGLDGFVGMGFTNTLTEAGLTGADDSYRGVMVAGKADAGGAKTDLVLRHRARRNDMTIGLRDDIIVPAISSTGTRFQIMKLEVNVDPGNPAGDDRITIWHQVRNALTESLARITNTGGAPLVVQSFSMETTADITQLTLAATDYGTSSHFDEPRIAADWSSLSGYAQTAWNHSGSETWDTAANWSNGLPTGVAAQFLTAITADATVNVTAPQNVGSLVFNNTHAYTLTGAGITLDVATGGLPVVLVESGSHNIAAPLTLADGTIFHVAEAGSTLNVSSDVIAEAGVSITKSGAGTLVMKNLRASTAVISEGTVRIAAGAGDAGVSKVVAFTLASGATLDLGDSKLVAGTPVGTWNGAAYSDLSGLVGAGRGGTGQWDGIGIVTSDARAVNGSNLVSIGVAKVGDVTGIADTATTTFAGQTVLGSDSLAVVTWGGDATLDGKVNIDDYGRIDANVASSGTVFGWYNGDFNYDGKINIDDYGIIDANVSAQTGQFPGTAGLEGASAVPEAGSLGLLCAGALSAFMRRRRT